MDHDIDEEDQDIEPKFLLPTEGLEASNIPSIDPETHARLEALLEAAGKHYLLLIMFLLSNILCTTAKAPYHAHVRVKRSRYDYECTIEESVIKL